MKTVRKLPLLAKKELHLSIPAVVNYEIIVSLALPGPLLLQTEHLKTARPFVVKTFEVELLLAFETRRL